MNRFATWACTLSLALAATCQAVAADQTQFNGTWQLQGAAIKQLRTADGKSPPLRPEARKLYEQRIAQLAKGDRSYDPGLQCKPLGNPRLLWEESLPFDLQVTAKRILVGYTWNRLHRLIDVKAGEPGVAGPTYMGTSTAQITGDTLVVESGGYNDMTLLDASGLPHSDALSMTERYRVTNKGQQLELRIRFVDDATFTQPWEALVKFKRVPDGRVREDVCEIRLGLYKETP
ncbi:MAG: hypothetical protein QM808_02125 [Steroidobacteraceae bacterium]